MPERNPENPWPVVCTSCSSNALSAPLGVRWFACGSSKLQVNMTHPQGVPAFLDGKQLNVALFHMKTTMQLCYEVEYKCTCIPEISRFQRKFALMVDCFGLCVKSQRAHTGSPPAMSGFS